MTGHPLAEDEIRFFNHCNHVWSQPGFGMSCMKIGPLSLALRVRLGRLGAVYGLLVTFECSDGQRFLCARRAGKKEAP